MALAACLAAGWHQIKTGSNCHPSASREDIAPLRLETYGLTDREREIATLVATGLSTKALADRLFLSPWTVQDHLKSIFDKTGTNSRRELRARIFFEEYLPRINTRTPIATNGALTPHAAHSPDFTWERLSP